MKDNLTLLNFEKEDSSSGLVNITYHTGEVEVIKADYMGISQEVPGFLMLWNEEPYSLEGFYNTRYIAKITTERINDNSKSN